MLSRRYLKLELHLACSLLDCAVLRPMSLSRTLVKNDFGRWIGTREEVMEESVPGTCASIDVREMEIVKRFLSSSCVKMITLSGDADRIAKEASQEGWGGYINAADVPDFSRQIGYGATL